MTPPYYTLIYKSRFFRSTKSIRDWIADNISTEKGREFILELDDFILSKIAAHPTHHMEWKWKRIPSKLYRRAVFKNKYVIVFKHFGNHIELLLIYHQSRDASKIKL